MVIAHDLTQGNETKAMLKLVLPMIIGNLFQQLYNVAYTVEIVNEKGYEYIKANFQYSILENYNAKVDDRIILERESWWKETLQTRKYGYNSN